MHNVANTIAIPAVAPPPNTDEVPPNGVLFGLQDTNNIPDVTPKLEPPGSPEYWTTFTPPPVRRLVAYSTTLAHSPLQTEIGGSEFGDVSPELEYLDLPSSTLR